MSTSGIRFRPWLLLLAATCVGPAIAAGCGSEPASVFTPPPQDAGTVTDTGPQIDEDAQFYDGPYTDFPKDPIIDNAAPANSAELFRDASTAGGGGPCLVEPEIGTMYPKNWLRPRFRWVKAAANQNLFEIRIHVENQTEDLIVYTTNDRYTLPKAMWDGLRTHSAGSPMTITVRAGDLQGDKLTSVVAGSGGALSIAPVEAPGTIVYWTGGSAGPGGTPVYNAVLKGFRIGDESVQEVLKPAQVGVVGGQQTLCLGCHNSTPDGLYSAVSARPITNGGGDPTRIAIRSVDGAATPMTITPSAQNLFNRSEQELPSFSPAHYKAGDKVALSLLRLDGIGFQIVWTNLEAANETQGTAWDVLKRNGDPNPYAALINFSHDGRNVAYVSTTDKDTSGTIVYNGDIYTVPYGDRLGGTAAPVPGANDPAAKQFYPAYSPDDKFIIYDRSTKGTTSYDDPNGEIYLIPASGGTATRIAANDPPACWPSKSPGIHNSWPKWSPGVRKFGGKEYYFVVFSSSRTFAKPAPRFHARLYVTPIVVEGDKITTYPALYLWNQPDLEDNHSPAWDEFKLTPPK
jgi:hypothetical protein